VRDTGIGIPREQLARIFEPFVQVVSGHTRSNDGSGLGLAISRRLARLMRGDITVRSEVGRGSTFTLWLPYAEPEQREEPSGGDEIAAVPAHSRGLAEIGEILMRELQRLLDAFVARLRAECPSPHAAGLKFSQLADHVASYLADLAGLLIALEEAAGQPTGVLVDAAEIHRVVAVRHGAQRARLGWSADAIRCEYQLLHEEIERVVREQCTTSAPAAIDGALAVTGRLIRQAERLSTLTMTRALAPRSGS
jgi:hypothetical protein